MKIHFVFIDLEVFSCSEKQEAAKLLTQEERKAAVMITLFMNCIISFLLAELQFWHFLKIAINDSTVEASCRFWLACLSF